MNKFQTAVAMIALTISAPVFAAETDGVYDFAVPELQFSGGLPTAGVKGIQASDLLSLTSSDLAVELNARPGLTPCPKSGKCPDTVMSGAPGE